MDAWEGELKKQSNLLFFYSLFFINPHVAAVSVADFLLTKILRMKMKIDQETQIRSEKKQ